MGEKDPLKIFLVAILPSILVIFIIFFLVMPKVRQGRVDPTPINPTEITWSQAVSAINSGQVEEVMQTHDLVVTLRMEDGTVLIAKEPQIDEVFTEIQKCGSKCGDIIMATE